MRPICNRTKKQELLFKIIAMMFFLLSAYSMVGYSPMKFTNGCLFLIFSAICYIISGILKGTRIRE